MIDLAHLRTLLSAATARPWRVESAYNNGGMPTSDFFIPGHHGDVSVEMLTADADLIVAAVNALPQLLAIAEAAQRYMEASRDLQVIAKHGGAGHCASRSSAPATTCSRHSHHPSRAMSDVTMPPDADCDSCGAPAGRWCYQGCPESPPPARDRLDRLASNLAIGAALCRAWQNGLRDGVNLCNGSDLEHED